MLGWKARWAALALAVFTLFASMLFHNFWAMAGAATPCTNQIMFMKNVVGDRRPAHGLGVRPGGYSVDRSAGHRGAGLLTPTRVQPDSQLPVVAGPARIAPN